MSLRLCLGLARASARPISRLARPAPSCSSLRAMSSVSDAQPLAADPTEKPKKGRPRKKVLELEPKLPKGRPKKVYPEGQEPPRRRTRAPKPPSEIRSKKHVVPQVEHGDGVELPPFDDWRHYFGRLATLHRRVTPRSPETAKMMAELFAPKGSKDLVIIESNPGAGLLTRALLALPRNRIKKVIVVEDAADYLRYLKPLEGVDDRLHVISSEAKQWSSYAEIEEQGLLDDVQQLDFDAGLHPNLRFVMHIPGDKIGEQFVAQILRTIPDRQFLFKYGRVPVSFILMDKMWGRLTAAPDTSGRCKLTVMAEATAETRTIVQPEQLQPFGVHFYPNSVLNTSPDTRPDSPKTYKFRVMTAIPHENQVIKPGDLDYWDYCTRRFFAMKRKPLREVINTLGPGAFNLLPKLVGPDVPEDQRLDLDDSAATLTIPDWERIVETFKKWPFRPQDLSVDGFNSKGVRENNNK